MINLKNKNCWFQYKTELHNKPGKIVGYFNDFLLDVFCEETTSYC
jgi:hypothetical protein